MKTLNITAAISLGLILFGINSIYAGQKGNNEGVVIAPLIRYHVTIHQPYEGRMCNIYIVRITDVFGNNVTPPQTYSAQVSDYTFYEAGPVKGIRVARLEIMPNGENYLCDPEFSVLPAVLSGIFMNGKTYSFDLYPTQRRIETMKRIVTIKY